MVWWSSTNITECSPHTLLGPEKCPPTNGRCPLWSQSIPLSWAKLLSATLALRWDQNKCTQMGSFSVRTVKIVSCFYVPDWEGNQFMVHLREDSSQGIFSVFMCLWLSVLKCPIKQGVCPKEVKIMQCFYVSVTMSKCPIKQCLCTREVKKCKFFMWLGSWQN